MIEPKRTLELVFGNQLEISNLFMSLGWGSVITRSGAF